MIDKKFSQLLLPAMIAAVVVALSSCMYEGGGTQDINTRTAALAGSAKLENKAVSGATVRIVDADYLLPVTHESGIWPARQIVTETDSAGNFMVDSLWPGIYSIEVLAFDRASGKSFGTRQIVQITGNSPIESVPSFSLERTGIISGRLALEQTNPLGATFMRVFGLARAAITDDSGYFNIRDVPAATYTIKMKSTDPALAGATIENVTVKSDSTVSLGTINTELGAYTDSVVVRAILDRIGSLQKPVSSVSTIESRRVVELVLSHESATAIPDILGRLISCRIIWLTHNTSLVTLPRSTGLLQNLERLYIVNTGITTLPEEIGSCTKLRVLNVINTNLSNVPSSIGNLVDLDTLQFISCNLVDLPEEITALKGVTYINISKTRISQVSSTVKAWFDSVQPGWEYMQNP